MKNIRKYTYNSRRILIAFVSSQIILGFLIYLVLGLVGYLDRDLRSTHIDFLNPLAFYLFLLYIPLLLIFYRHIQKTNKFADNVQERVRHTWLSPVSTFHTTLKFIFFLNALTFLIFTLAQPVLGTKKTEGSIQSMELAVVLDISKSMDAKDIDPKFSRLQIAKRALDNMINGLGGEKISLVLFAGSAFVQLPLTTDYYAAKIFLDDINSDMMGQQGTNINQALITAESVFSEEKIGKAILLITDGENHEASPNKVFKELQEKNIQFFVLGIGTQSGGTIPLQADRPELGNKRTAAGLPVITKINPKFINQLIKESGGSGMISESAFPDIQALTSKIKQIKKSTSKGMEFDVQENRYQYPLAGAIFFALMYLLWSSKNLNFIKRKA